MSIISIIVLAFSLLGALDWLFGSKIGIGKEFERGFALFGPMALSMLGMIVIAPAVGVWLTPLFESFYNTFGIDPSVIPASIFANDMGGMSLARAVCKANDIGNYNAFVVSSMMGCVISFTIPFSLGLVKKEQHRQLFFGLLCGIVTIPIGCFVSGLMCGISPFAVLLNLLPLIIIAGIVATALLLVPNVCIKCFAVFGTFIKAVAVMGLCCAIFTFLTKIEINQNFDTLENGAFICANACITLSGALPFMYAVSKILKKPLGLLSKKIGINEVSALAFLGTIVTNASTFGVMDKMDKKGTVLNSAFAVSASFTFGGHLALTLAYDASYVPAMIVGKLISGVLALLLALLIYKDTPDLKKS